MLLWLDDVRYPPTNKWLWVKTAQEAIDVLKSGNVQFASLDHDLLPEHYPWATNYDPIEAEKTNGKAVTNFLEEQVIKYGNTVILPDLGIRVHSMNTYGACIMFAAIIAMYSHKSPRFMNSQCIETPEIEVLPWQLYGQPNGWYLQHASNSIKIRYQNARHSS